MNVFGGGRKLLLLVLRTIVSLGTQACRWSALRGGLSKGSQPVFTRVSEKTTENSERLDRQARPRIEPGTSRLPVFERSHWWGQKRSVSHPCFTRNSSPGLLKSKLASLTSTSLGQISSQINNIYKCKTVSRLIMQYIIYICMCECADKQIDRLRKLFFSCIVRQSLAQKTIFHQFTLCTDEGS